MRDIIAAVIAKCVPKNTPIEVTVPERKEFGHYSSNAAMRLARQRGENPMILAGEIARKIAGLPSAKIGIEKVEAAPPGFLNFWIAPALLRRELLRVLAQKEKYARRNIGRGKRVIVEFSSPNVAKEMHVGHLRNTVLGNALANLHEAAGYKVIRWNYLGDWGTQFGKVIAAYKHWGSRREVERAPITTLVGLYVRFNREAKANPDLDGEARAEFKKLEDGNGENRRLWEWFKKESLKEFKAVYRRLGVRFDVWIGESFYEKEMQPLAVELLKRKVAVRSEGAVMVPLDGAGLPPAMVAKSDGASTYLTRDLANLRYRVKKYKPAKILYVVGNEQSLHFEQVFAAGRRMGLVKREELTHVKYGLVLGETGKKFSTREGEAVTAAEVMGEAAARARAVVNEKRRELSAREQAAVAEKVGLGSLKYANLKDSRTTDIVFDWERMLDFTGDSAPYLLYTYARLMSIIRKARTGGHAAARFAKKDAALLVAERELCLMRRMAELPYVVESACVNYAPNAMALYLYELANCANRYYESTPVLADADAPRRRARLMLVQGVTHALRAGLKLLGIEAPERI